MVFRAGSPNNDITSRYSFPNPNNHPKDEFGRSIERNSTNETGLSDQEIQWFRERIEAEKNFEEKDRVLSERYSSFSRDSQQVPELASSTLYVWNCTQNEQAYVGVHRLFRMDYFKNQEGSQGLDIDNKDHQRVLALARSVFGNQEEFPKDLSFENRFLAMKILSAYNSTEYSKKFPIDEENVERLSSGLGLFKIFEPFVSKIQGGMEILKLFSTQSDMTKSQFQRIFGDNIPADKIPLILRSGCKFEKDLTLELLSKHSAYVQSKLPGQSSVPVVEQPSALLTFKDKAETCSEIANFLETAKTLDFDIPDDVRAEMIRRYGEALPTQQEVEEETKRDLKEVDKLQQDEANILKQEKINRAVKQVAQDLAHIIHGWSQRTKNIEGRKDRLRQTKGDFHELVDRLGIKDIPKYQELSIRGLQDLIEHKIIEAKARGIDILKAVPKAYAEDVERTRRAILQCVQQNGTLKDPHNDLKKLGDMIIKHEKSAEKNLERIAKGLRAVHLVFDAIKIAGTIASFVPSGQAAGLALNTAGEIGQQATGLADNYNNRRWDAQYSWCLDRLSAITQAEAMLFNVNANLQDWNQVLLGRQYEQQEFLLKNPQLFRPHSYLHNLREAVIQVRNNLENIDSKISQTQAKVKECADGINQVIPEIDSSEHKLHRAKKKAKKHFDHKRQKTLNRAAGVVTKNKVRLATLHAEKANSQHMGSALSLQREEEIQRLEAMNARIEEYVKIADLPDHHKEGAENLPIPELIRSSKIWQQKLEGELEGIEKELNGLASESSNNDLMHKIEDAKERKQACLQKMEDEKIFSAQIEQQGDIERFRSVSSGDHADLIPTLRENARNRITSLRQLVSNQQELEHELCEKESKLRRSLDGLQWSATYLDPSDNTRSAGEKSRYQNAHNQFGVLKDELDEVREQRSQVIQRQKEVEAAIQQEDTYCNIQLWKEIERLPLDDRLSCAKKSLESCITFYQTQAQKSQIASKIQDEAKALRQETVRYCNLSLQVDIERWEQTAVDERGGLLLCMRLSSSERHKLFVLAQEEAACSKKIFQTDVTKAKGARDQAETSLRRGTTADAIETQRAFDEANRKYQEARKGVMDADLEEKFFKERVLQNEEALKSAFTEGYITEMKSTLLWLQMKNRNPAEQALYDELGNMVQEFGNSNILTLISNFIDLYAWCGETMSKKPYSAKERESYARRAHYFRAASAVATLGVDLWSFNKLVQARWERKHVSSVAVTPHMGWIRYASELVIAMYYGGPIGIALQVSVALRAAGMAAQALKLWNGEIELLGPSMTEQMHGLSQQMGGFEGRMNKRFKTMEESLNEYMLDLTERQDQMSKEVRKNFQKLTNQVKAFSKSIECLIKITDARLQGGYHAVQKSAVNQEIASFATSCIKTQIWLDGQSSRLIEWLPKYLQCTKNTLKRSLCSDITGKDYYNTVDLSRVVETPHHYVGLLGESMGLGFEVPSILFFNEVADFLVKVGKKALDRNLPVGDLASLRPNVSLALSYASLIQRFLDQMGGGVGRASHSFQDLRTHSTYVLQEAERKRREILSNVLEESIDDCQNTLTTLVKEDSQRFLISHVIHEESLGKAINLDHLKKEFEQLALQQDDQARRWDFGAKHALLGLGSGSSAILSGYGVVTIGTALGLGLAGGVVGLGLGLSFYGVRKCIDKTFLTQPPELTLDLFTKSLNELQLNTNSVALSRLSFENERHVKAQAQCIEIDLISTQSGSLRLREFRVVSQREFCWRNGEQKDSIKVGAPAQAQDLQAIFIISARIRHCFDVKQTRDIAFYGNSLIQAEDVNKIQHIGSSSLPGDHYKSSKEYDKKVKEFFVAVGELITLRKNTPSGHPLFSVVKSSTFIPPVPKAKGMPPLAMPSELINGLTEKLQDDLSLLHLAQNGTLVPYYELRQTESDGGLALDIVFYHQNKMKEEFSRFREVFVIDQFTQSALEGVCSKSNQPLTYVQASRILFYVMYGGLMELGMPGHESYELENGKGVAPVDLPYEGFYQKLLKDAKNGVQFYANEFEGELSIETWSDPIEERASFEKTFIMNEARASILLDTRKNKEFQAYEKSYYEAMALMALNHSLNTKNSSGSDGQTIIEDMPACANIEKLLGDFGLPTPNEILATLHTINNRPIPNVDGLAQQLSRKDLTVHTRKFTELFRDLISLSGSLSNFNIARM